MELAPERKRYIVDGIMGNEAPKIIYQNGTEALNLVKFDSQTQSILIQTDNEDYVGTQKTIIRSCDSLDRLLEMNLYIDVVANTFPEFVNEPETSFVMDVNDVFEYKLPKIVDPEGNDKPELYIGEMDGQEDKFPDFISFDNSTSTIRFAPNSIAQTGRTFYFTLVVKETNSDSVKYSYYCTVRINGEI